MIFFLILEDFRAFEELPFFKQNSENETEEVNLDMSFNHSTNLILSFTPHFHDRNFSAEWRGILSWHCHSFQTFIEKRSSYAQRHLHYLLAKF